MSDNINSNEDNNKNIHVNAVINESALANSIDNAVKSIIKERRRGRFGAFFAKLVILIIIGLVIIGLVETNSPSSVTNSTSNSTSHVAVVSINGEISANSAANAELINNSLKNAFENQNSVAVILKINSPGGSPVQAGMVYDEIKRLRKIYPKKVIYAVIEDICASGGYYIASATDFIYADKASIVGSIGVIMEGFGFDKAIEKFGVQRRLYTSGENKALLDPFSAENPAQTAYVKHMITTIHQQFIKAVKDGRGKRLKEEANTFSGLIWTGEEAAKNGIIDGLSSTENLSRVVIKNDNLVDYTVQEGLANRLAKQFGASIGTSIANKIDLKIK